MWWLANASIICALSGVATFREYGPGTLLVSAFGGYMLTITASFALWPDDLPRFIGSICIGNIEEEFHALMWPDFEDVPADLHDRTWWLPSTAAVLEVALFLRNLGQH